MIHLSDAALQDFIIRGYRVVQPTADLHGELHRQVERVLATGNPGNDLIDRVPLLHQLFADPAIDAALTGILGPGYALNRHCHCHDLAPGNQAQAWHKDYPLGGNMRYHRPRYALLLYYPHEVTPDMGPTALVPGTQYYMDGPGDEVEGLALTCAAGTVVITHYELWHRATANRSTRTRYMLKFLFARTEESRPEQRSKWMPTGRHATLYRTLWRWYGGQAPALRPQRSVEALQAALQDLDERVRLDAYYDLGALGVEGVPVLMAALKDESARCWQANLERGDFTNPSQLESPYGLAAAGAVAVATLIAQRTCCFSDPIAIEPRSSDARPASPVFSTMRYPRRSGKHPTISKLVSQQGVCRKAELAPDVSLKTKTPSSRLGLTRGNLLRYHN